MDFDIKFTVFFTELPEKRRSKFRQEVADLTRVTVVVLRIDVVEVSLSHTIGGGEIMSPHEGIDVVVMAAEHQIFELARRVFGFVLENFDYPSSDFSGVYQIVGFGAVVSVVIVPAGYFSELCVKV